MSYRGDCCHYEDGYEDGLRDGQTDGMGDGLAQACADMLERVQAELYRLDALSILACECEGLRKEIKDCMRTATR